MNMFLFLKTQRSLSEGKEAYMSKTKYEVNIDDIVLKRTISAAILNLNKVELH